MQRQDKTYVATTKQVVRKDANCTANAEIQFAI